MEESRHNPEDLSTVPLKPFIGIETKLFTYKYFNIPNRKDTLGKSTFCVSIYFCCHQLLISKLY